MHRHVVEVFVMLCVVVCFSYHALLSLKYESCMAKTTTTKKLAQETGISVREAERHLDANVFLDKYLRWVPLGSHCPFLLHQMFTHAAATGQKEHDQAIHWDQWQPSPEWELGAEPSTMDLVGPEMF